VSAPGRRSRLFLITLACLLALAAVTVARPPKTPGPFARDFEAYYAGGATWLAGGSPWSRDVWAVERTIDGVDSGRDELLPFVGPPPYLPLWSALARLPFFTASIVWSSILAAAFVVLLWCGVRLAGGPNDRVSWIAIGLAALIAGPVLSDFALGQVALVSAAALAWALLALERRSPWASVAVFLSAIQPNLALPLAAGITRRRSLLTCMFAGFVFCGASIWCAGGLANALNYLRLLSAHGAAERFVSIQHTVPVIVASLGFGRPLAQNIGTVVTIVTAFAVVTLAVAFRARQTIASVATIALLPLALPFFHEHDFVVIWIPALVAFRDVDPRVRRWAGCAGIAVFVDWFGLAQRPPAQLQITFFALALALLIIAWTTSEHQQIADYAPLVAVLILLSIAIPIAHLAPAPTWPDGMGLAFHAPQNANVSTVWALEQQASGLDRDVLGWGILRAFPLLGSLIYALTLAFVGLRDLRSSYRRTA
jgi:Glycosyltransferase family 87